MQYPVRTLQVPPINVSQHLPFVIVNKVPNTRIWHMWRPLTSQKISPLRISTVNGWYVCVWKGYDILPAAIKASTTSLEPEQEACRSALHLFSFSIFTSAPLAKRTYKITTGNCGQEHTLRLLVGSQATKIAVVLLVMNSFTTVSWLSWQSNVNRCFGRKQAKYLASEALVSLLIFTDGILRSTTWSGLLSMRMS